MISGAATGQRPSDDFSLTGPLIGPLWVAAGVSMFLAAFFGATSGRYVLVPVGVVTLATGAALIRFEVARLPRALLIGSAYFAVVVMVVDAALSRGTLLVWVAMVPALLVWVGLAMELLHVVLVFALCEGLLFVAGLGAGGLGTALSTVVLSLPMLASTTGACFYFRRRLDAEKASADAARDQARAVELAARAEAEASDRAQAEQSAERLRDRERLQTELADQVTDLSSASVSVSAQTETVATAVAQISESFAEINRSAQSTEQITTEVATLAHEAQVVMERLAASSSEIMTASSVIQGISEQTNLLALNATIESARAGDMGRGFAVVANEVKDLARQSGQHADAISGTLAQIQAEVRAAADHVADITERMGDLQGQNGTLAAAMEEQTAMLSQIVTSVHEAANQTDRITQGIRTLEEISHQA